jgi:hypothetical protein
MKRQLAAEKSLKWERLRIKQQEESIARSLQVSHSTFPEWCLNVP